MKIFGKYITFPDERRTQMSIGNKKSKKIITIIFGIILVLLIILLVVLTGHKRSLAKQDGMLPVKRTIKNNKFLYRQPCYGWRYFMLLLYIAHDISLVSLHAVSFEVVGCCSNLCN